MSQLVMYTLFAVWNLWLSSHTASAVAVVRRQWLPSAGLLVFIWHSQRVLLLNDFGSPIPAQHCLFGL
jgi:hypothetical protein